MILKTLQHRSVFNLFKEYEFIKGFVPPFSRESYNISFFSYLRYTSTLHPSLETFLQTKSKRFQIFAGFGPDLPSPQSLPSCLRPLTPSKS